MEDEQVGREVPILAEGDNLFAEVVRRTAVKAEEEKRKSERENAGRVVVKWLKMVGQKEEIKAKIPLNEIVSKVLEGLREGRIFFAVRSPEKMEESVRARRPEVTSPPRKFTNPANPSQSVEAKIQGIIVVLEVKSGVELSELHTPQGEDQLRKLFEDDMGMIGNKKRIITKDLAIVNIKDPDIGLFPKLE